MRSRSKPHTQVKKVVAGPGVYFTAARMGELSDQEMLDRLGGV
jgi:hypothetical protein